MKAPFLLIAIFLTCALADASSLKGDLLQEIFIQSSGLPTEQSKNSDSQDFSFDVGVIGTPQIIKGMRGGNAIIKWADDQKSFVQIRIYAQKRYDKYVDDLVIPMDIIKGVSTDTSKALLEANKLRDSWKVEEIPDVGVYCFGKHLPGMGPVPVNSGYFFDDKYGFCLQISTPETSGVALEAVGEIGRRIVGEIAAKIKEDGVSPNPLNRVGEPFKTVAKLEKGTRSVVNDEARSPKPRLAQQHDAGERQGESGSKNAWITGLILLGALLAITLAWRHMSKK